MRDLSNLIEAVSKLYDAPFSVIVEMMLNEAAQFVNLKDWETNQQRFGKNEKGEMVGSRDITLAYDDIEKTVVPGASISKTKNIFLPFPFAMPKEEAEAAMRRMLATAKQKGSVTVSTWPAYGVEAMGAFPAAVVKSLPAEEQNLAMQTGVGGAIFAIDGNPLSRVSVMSMPIGADDENLTEYAKWTKWAGITTDESGELMGGGRGGRGEEGPPPEWLVKLAAVIDDTIKSGTVNVETSRMKGFPGEIIFSTPHGDSVLVISRERSKAGYVFKKKINLDGAPTDYDVAISKKMSEFQTSYSRKPRGIKKTGETEPIPGSVADIRAAARKAKEQLRRAGEQQEAGEKRPPKLMLRDWLRQTENGYALRRDFRAEDIKRLLNGGINYEDGLRLSEPGSEIPVNEPVAEPLSQPEPEATEPATPEIPGTEAFEDKIEWAMADPIMESIDSFMSIIEKPWSVDDKGLFKYLESSEDPVDIENWVDALDIAVNERGLGNRWVFALVEQTYEKLSNKMPIELRPIVMGMLEQIQAAPYPREQDVPGPDLPPEPPKRPDFDDDYNPEADQR